MLVHRPSAGSARNLLKLEGTNITARSMLKIPALYGEGCNMAMPIISWEIFYKNSASTVFVREERVTVKRRICLSTDNNLRIILTSTYTPSRNQFIWGYLNLIWRTSKIRRPRFPIHLLPGWRPMTIDV